MVQEAGLPIQDVTASISADNPRGRTWLTAVVSYGLPLAPLEQPVRPVRNADLKFSIPDAARPGTLALAAFDVPGVGSVLAVSLYGKLRYAAQSVLRAASDLLPIFQAEVGRHVVLAGDLNMHTAVNDEGIRSRTMHILGLLESFGLCDLVRDAKMKGLLTHGAAPGPCKYQPCSHVRTHRHSRHEREAIGSIDYMFATLELAARLMSLVVMNGRGPRVESLRPCAGDCGISSLMMP
jgi:endonuclease/exonuclease/phosphatase family metal-dependent hydrolase